MQCSDVMRYGTVDIMQKNDNRTGEYLCDQAHTDRFIHTNIIPLRWSMAK